MVSDHGTRLAFVTENWSGETRTNLTGGAATGTFSVWMVTAMVRVPFSQIIRHSHKYKQQTLEYLQWNGHCILLCS